MKIIMTATTIPGSGVWGMGIGMSRYNYNLSKALREMGHDVTMFIRDDFRPREKWIVPVYAPKQTWIFYPPFLWNRLLREKADVYHAEYLTNGTPLVLANKHPCLVMAHDVIPLVTEYKVLREKVQQWYYKASLEVVKHADVIAFMTKTAMDLAIEKGLPEEKLRYIYNAIDFDQFYPLPQKERKDVVRIGYFGGLNGRKNATMLVEAFKILVKKYDNIELHIAGTGTILPTFKAMKIPRAHFYGYIPDEKANVFVNALDIFVFPSILEGFGLMLAEAMSTGRAIVGLNASTTPELLDDTGLIAEPNAQALAEKIEVLINDAALRKKLGKKAYERSRMFSWENCAKNTLKVYKEIVEARRR